MRGSLIDRVFDGRETDMNYALTDSELEFSGVRFSIFRSHAFGLVVNGLIDGQEIAGSDAGDYLHQFFLAPDHRESFWELLDAEKLVVCKNVRSSHPGYRKVRGKSSAGKLSQAEYFHHDGCSCPVKPRVVEIRLPHQNVDRQIATAIAPFRDVVRSMLSALPDDLRSNADVSPFLKAFETNADGTVVEPPVESWDGIQGKVTRLVRRELDAEACRAWFREVDRLADAYVQPWEMGESRLMLNNHADLTQTMQHRRAYQQPRAALEQNGSLVKRWPAEELLEEQTCLVPQSLSD